MKRFSFEVFEEYRETFLNNYGPLVTRKDLVNVCPFFNANTLRNKDYEGKGITGACRPTNRAVYYPVPEVLSYMQKNFVEEQSFN